MTRRKLLITGAAGRIGGYLGRTWQERYDLRLTDRKPLDYPIEDNTEYIQAETSDLDAMQKLCEGIDTVVHLAADPSMRADFYESLLENNIKGLYNGFQAAVDQGCRRVVYASSVNAVNAYPASVTVTENSLPNPQNHYGACKVLGEALAHSFRYTHELSSFCIRFGGVWLDVREQDPDHEAMWISIRDAAQLIGCCVEATNVDFAIAHGFSRHLKCRYSIEKTCRTLGYEPQDGTAISASQRPG